MAKAQQLTLARIEESQQHVPGDPNQWNRRGDKAFFRNGSGELIYITEGRDWNRGLGSGNHLFTGLGGTPTPLGIAAERLASWIFRQADWDDEIQNRRMHKAMATLDLIDRKNLVAGGSVPNIEDIGYVLDSDGEQLFYADEFYRNHKGSVNRSEWPPEIVEMAARLNMDPWAFMNLQKREWAKLQAQQAGETFDANAWEDPYETPEAVKVLLDINQGGIGMDGFRELREISRDYNYEVDPRKPNISLRREIERTLDNIAASNGESVRLLPGHMENVLHVGEPTTATERPDGTFALGRDGILSTDLARVWKGRQDGDLTAAERAEFLKLSAEEQRQITTKLVEEIKTDYGGMYRNTDDWRVGITGGRWPGDHLQSTSLQLGQVMARIRLGPGWEGGTMPFVQGGSRSIPSEQALANAGITLSQWRLMNIRGLDAYHGSLTGQVTY